MRVQASVLGYVKKDGDGKFLRLLQEELIKATEDVKVNLIHGLFRPLTSPMRGTCSLIKCTSALLMGHGFGF